MNCQVSSYSEKDIIAALPDTFMLTMGDVGQHNYLMQKNINEWKITKENGSTSAATVGYSYRPSMIVSWFVNHTSYAKIDGMEIEDYMESIKCADVTFDDDVYLFL